MHADVRSGSRHHARRDRDRDARTARRMGPAAGGARRFGSLTRNSMSESAHSAPNIAPAHPAHAGHGEHAPQSFFHKYLWSTDHKVIAMQYTFTGMALGIVAAFMAY